MSDKKWLHRQWAIALLKSALSEESDLKPWERRNKIREVANLDLSVYFEEKDRFLKKLKLLDDALSLRRL